MKIIKIRREKHCFAEGVITLIDIQNCLQDYNISLLVAFEKLQDTYVC